MPPDEACAGGAPGMGRPVAGADATRGSGISGGAESADADVLVIGAGLAGAAVALLLLREEPELRVVLVDRLSGHGRKVGEATVEISTYFLMRVLGLTEHLQQQHLVKQGLRFWFANGHTRDLSECSEIGGRYLSRVPSFQVDRAVLDEELLRRVAAAGARVIRPAQVQRVDLRAGGLQGVHVRTGEEVREWRVRWVVDASGPAMTLARQEGWRQANAEHPTSTAWARWRGVKDWDGLELAARFPCWGSAHHGLRGTATNHLMGPGWWAWMIPLRGGDTSIGVVFDERHVELPRGGSLAERLKDFLSAHPVGREMMEKARPVEGDSHWRRHIACQSARLAGDGFVLVGDAAGFLDPFYSPGMDWVTYTVMRAVDLIRRARRGECVATLAARFEADFRRSYRRWFEAIYKDKYAYMGDCELMGIAFQCDLGLYYFGVASQPYRRGATALLEPTFVTPPSVPVFHFMRFYNRRLAAMAMERRRRGTFGGRNAGWRRMVPGFTFSPLSAKPVLAALARWLWLEMTEGWRTWWRGALRPEAAADRAGGPGETEECPDPLASPPVRPAEMSGPAR